MSSRLTVRSCKPIQRAQAREEYAKASRPPAPPKNQSGYEHLAEFAARLEEANGAPPNVTRYEVGIKHRDDRGGTVGDKKIPPRVITTWAANANEMDRLVWKVSGASLPGVQAYEEIEGLTDPFRYAPMGGYASRKDYLHLEPVERINQGDDKPDLYVFGDIWEKLHQLTSPAEAREMGKKVDHLWPNPVTQLAGNAMGGYVLAGIQGAVESRRDREPHVAIFELNSDIHPVEDKYIKTEPEMLGWDHYAKVVGTKPRGFRVVLHGLETVSTKKPIDHFTTATVWTGPEDSHDVALEDLYPILGAVTGQRLKDNVEELLALLIGFRKQAWQEIQKYVFQADTEKKIRKELDSREPGFYTLFPVYQNTAMGWNSYGFSSAQPWAVASQRAETLLNWMKEANTQNQDAPMRLYGFCQSDEQAAALRDFGLARRKEVLALYEKIQKQILKGYEKLQAEERRLAQNIVVIENAAALDLDHCRMPTVLGTNVGYLTVPTLIPDPNLPTSDYLKLLHPGLGDQAKITLSLFNPTAGVTDVPEDTAWQLVIARKFASDFQLNPLIGSALLIKTLAALFRCYHRRQELVGYTLGPGQVVEVPYSELSREIWPGKKQNSEERRRRKKQLYLAIRFLDSIEVYNQGMDYPRFKRNQRIAGIIKDHGDWGENEHMDVLQYGLEGNIHRMLYGSADEISFTYHKADVLLSRSPKHEERHIRAQTFLEAQLKTVFIHHGGELATRAGDHWTMQRMMEHMGDVGIPKYKTHRNEVTGKVIEACEQLVDDGVLGSFSLHGRGQDHQRKVETRLPDNIIAAYNASMAAAKAKRENDRIKAKRLARQAKQKESTH